MTQFFDMHQFKEDDRIDTIGKTVMDLGAITAFIVEADGAKADRYIRKLAERWPKVRILGREPGPTKGVETVRVGPPLPSAGKVYDITFRNRVDLGPVRVRVLAADEPTDKTPCGAETIPVEVISGRIPRNNNGELVWVEAGQVTTMAVFLCQWHEVQE